jgi:DNA-binding CsgD family transcriptional regulator
MIRRGLSSNEIARLLKISVRTVEVHRNRIRKKLDITDKDVNLVTYLNNI